MRKVLSFSLFLMAGLVASQLLPGALGAGYGPFKAAADTQAVRLPGIHQ